MTRAIKFRVWDAVHEHWIEGLTYTLHTSGNLINIPDGMILMQFTGLLDKNGVEIYEGDIVRGNNPWENEGDALQVVRYQDGTWNYSYALYEYAEHPERDWEVIGNIYEHPELVR